MAWNRLNAVILTAEILNALQAAERSGAPWSDSAHDEAKDALKRALFDAQESLCGYCRREIRDESGRVEIDHVLPKAQSRYITHAASNLEAHRRSTIGYPQFAFCGSNLVLTCKRCNNKKGTYDARADRVLAAPAMYPIDPNAFIWIHPYLHNYSEHIEISRGYVFRPINDSAGARAVIKVCKLNTLAAVEAKAVERAIKSTPSLEPALMRIWAQPQLDDEQGAAALSARFQILDSRRVREVLSRYGRSINDLTAVAGEIRAMMP